MIAEELLENCERCGHLMPEGCIGWCADCDREEKAHGECPNCAIGCYGAFHGGDPRLFSPDPECSTEEERLAHEKACKAWDRGEAPEFNVSRLEMVEHKGQLVPGFAERSEFGLGVHDVRCDLHKVLS